MGLVTLKDPIERGLKDLYSRDQGKQRKSGYTQRPDRKGTERDLLPPNLRHDPDIVTLKDPIERGLKGLLPHFSVGNLY